ncbi:MAG: PH domain-containing protein [Bacilli bacterium]|nr:PH domain-containing protein [Bacilli bacterium]
MESIVYKKVKEFKRRYPMTISWRLKQHCKVIDTHINPGEVVKYAFAAQKNDTTFDIISTNVIVLTNKRILLGQKRLLFGYFYTAITPDLFNDLEVIMGLLWGKIQIDTVKEVVMLSKIQKEALAEIETYITEYMMEEKQKYRRIQQEG